MSRRTNSYVGAVGIAALGAIILWLMRRPLICTCGKIELWVNSASSPKTSQMLADWYSLSHIVHGIIFFGILWVVARKMPIERRFQIAMFVETAWEVVENSPLVINRYRHATIANGYVGDSVLNSMSDIAMMAFGFLLARKLPLWMTVLLTVILELVPLFVIRDNLTLNVWMLLRPNHAIGAWQAGGAFHIGNLF